MAHLSSAKSAGTLSIRAGVSPKLLARKSAEKANASPRIEGVEESFPSQVPKSPDLTTAVVGSASTTGPAQEPVAGAPAPAAAVGKLGATAWSEEDESCFQALFAKRKAARVRRVANGGTQQLQPGGIKPNPDTVVAVIVGIVAQRHGMSRSELVAEMATATFPHPKARPTDVSWCQGYIAGAIRSGYLAFAVERGGHVLEHSQSAEADSSVTAELERSTEEA